MISSAFYTETTGEAAPAGFAGLAARVASDLGTALGRFLETGTYTETLRYYRDGFVWPAALPITAVETYFSDGKSIELGPQPATGSATITYTGGFAPYGSGTDHDLPPALAMAIAYGIQTMSSEPAEPVVPMGVTSLNVGGEFSVTVQPGQVWGRDGYPVPVNMAAYSYLGGRCLQCAAPYRRIA